MSLKGKKIPLEGRREDGTQIYKKTFRKEIKKEIEMNEENLKTRYGEYFISLKRKGKKKEEIRETYKNLYNSFFIKCEIKEEEIIGTLEQWEKELEEQWEKEPDKVISFDQYIKKNKKGTRTDGRTMD